MNRLIPILPLVALLAGCAGSEAQKAEETPPQPVRVAPVVQEEVNLPIIGTGTLGAKEELQLGFKIGGVIGRIGVNPGERVRAGQALAVLEQGEIDAAVSRARAAADNADRELARARRLYTDSVVSLSRLQGAEAAAEVARADLNTAVFNRQYARIVAPSGGVVLRRLREPGELVSSGESVLVLASDSRGSVLRVGLADRDVVRVREGDKAEVRFEAVPGRVFEGRVSEVGAAAQAGTGTYLVDIRLPGAGGLVSGLIGTVEIHTRATTRAMMVPVEALLEADGSQGTVYALTPDRKAVERREVVIGFMAGDRIAVARGLDGASAVVTDGAAYLRDGSRVEVLP
ncbi:MAG: efflux RND transporter periplasmic adaptor subunit [Gemmatimonadales bacterium]